MAEYIGREVAKKMLEEYRISRTMSMYGDMDHLMEWREGVKCSMKKLDEVPTADVVPKSEVEKLKAELEHYHKANLRQSLIIGQMDLTHRQFLKELDEIFKEHKEGFYCDWYLYSRYDELKNKYKEQKENGSDDERPNRRNV